MANSVSSGDYKEYATIDTAPSASGYWTNEVSPRGRNRGIIRALFFSIRGTVSSTVTLQFKCDGDSDWTDYNNEATAFVVGDRKQISIAGAKVRWRAGVKDGDFVADDDITLGFDW